MKSISAVAVLVVAVAVASIGAQQARPAAPEAQRANVQTPYFPERFDWQHKRPDEVGMNAALVAEAVQAAVSGEISDQPRSRASSRRRASAGTSRSTR